MIVGRAEVAHSVTPAARVSNKAEYSVVGFLLRSYSFCIRAQDATNLRDVHLRVDR